MTQCAPSRHQEAGSLKRLNAPTEWNTTVVAEVALMTLGKTSFCDIVAHQKDSLFVDAAGGAIPSEATFRQRLEYLSALSGVTNWIDEADVELLSMVGDFGLVKTQFTEYLPVDIDVYVLVNDNCKKENAAFTYHRINGFAPIFATIGRHGYQLANELRPGNQHSQKEFPGFLRRCVRLVRRFYDRRILVRIDSAHDADDTLATGFALDDEMRASLEGSALDFIVKRNARHEDERMWIEQANGECIDRPLDALRPVVEFGEANFDYPFTSLAHTFTDSGTYAHKRRIGHGGDKT